MYKGSIQASQPNRAYLGFDRGSTTLGGSVMSSILRVRGRFMEENSGDWIE